MKYRCFLCASSGHREPLWKVPQSTLPGNPPCGSVTLQGVHGLENMGKMEGTTDVQWFSHISPITFGSLSFVRVSAFFLWRDHRFSINTPPLIDSPTSFPMIFPWFSHDVPMIFPWFSHDFPMIFPWFSHDLPGPAGWVHCREGTSSKSLDAGGDLVNFLGDRLGKWWFLTRENGGSMRFHGIYPRKM